MIELNNIHKSFGQLEVLRGVSIAIQDKEVVSIVGPSGAGKTTLLQIAGTLLRPDQGEVLIGGEQVLRLSGNKLATFRNRHIGFIFQFHRLLPEFTALENIMIPGLIAKRQSGELEKQALELLDFMGLVDRAHHKPAQLSGGEQQRISVARALINRPDVILADEPSGSLDSKNKEELHQLFFKLRDELGHTFIIVTHDEHLAQITDRTIHLIDGQVQPFEQEVVPSSLDVSIDSLSI